MSDFINWLTFGPKGASLCGRAYLYHKYVKPTWWVCTFIWIIDAFRYDHCKHCAEVWQEKVVRSWGGLKYPTQYKCYFFPDGDPYGRA